MNKVFRLIEYSIIAASPEQQTTEKSEDYKTHNIEIKPSAT